MLMGRAADLLGRRRVLLAGFALFGAASLACGLATSRRAADRGPRRPGPRAPPPSSPAALALLTAGTPEGRARTRALAAWTAAAAGGGALGWVRRRRDRRRARLAVGVPRQRRRRARSRSSSRCGCCPPTRGRRGEAPLDVAGAVSATAGLALLVLGFTRAEQAGAGRPERLGLARRQRRLLLAFARIERRAADPLLPPGTLRAAAAGRRAARLAGHHHGEHRPAVPVRALPPARAGPAGDRDRAAVRAVQPRRDRRLRGGRAARRRRGPARDRRRRGGPARPPRRGRRRRAARLPRDGPRRRLRRRRGDDARARRRPTRERQGLASGLLNTAAQLGNALGLSAFVLLAAAVPAGPDAGFRVACATAAATAVAGALAFGALQRRG